MLAGLGVESNVGRTRFGEYFSLSKLCSPHLTYTIGLLGTYYKLHYYIALYLCIATLHFAPAFHRPGELSASPHRRFRILDRTWKRALSLENLKKTYNALKYKKEIPV